MSIKERLKLVISNGTRDRTRYVQLKELTGISGDIWKNFWFDRREPDALMLEAVGRAWPKYAYWLITGATDVTSGHLCPQTAFCYEPSASTLITSDAFLTAGVDAAKIVDEAFKTCPEEEEEIAIVIHKFLEGESAHVLPKQSFWLIDQAFKKIRSFNQIAKVRNKEIEMQSQT